MTLVYRKIRKGEQLKVNRLLMQDGYIYDPRIEYMLITTDNPAIKGRRLIVAVIGKTWGKILQLSVAPKYRWTEALAFGLKKQLEQSRYQTANLKLRPWHVYAFILGGWCLRDIDKGRWEFYSRTVELYRIQNFKMPQFNFSKLEKSMGFFYKLPEAPVEIEPYILEERVVNWWQFIKHDPEYRAFKNWKPTIQITTTNLRDVIPFGQRFTVTVPGKDIVDTYWLRSEIRNKIRKQATLEQYSSISNMDFDVFKSWMDEKGVRATKRIQKAIYDLTKFKLDDRTMEAINLWYRNHGAMPITVQYEFSPKIDWLAGQFGDSGSCWLATEEGYTDNTDHRHFSYALNTCGHGLALKIYSENGNGFGRAFGSVEQDNIYLFNLRCASTINYRALIGMVAQQLNLKYQNPPNLEVNTGDYNSRYWRIYIENEYAIFGRDPRPTTLQFYVNGKRGTDYVSA